MAHEPHIWHIHRVASLWLWPWLQHDASPAHQGTAACFSERLVCFQASAPGTDVPFADHLLYNCCGDINMCDTATSGTVGKMGAKGIVDKFDFYEIIRSAVGGVADRKADGIIALEPQPRMFDRRH